ANDFALYRDALKEMIDIKREEATLLGWEDHPYDALLNDYEPGFKSAQLDTLFTDVRRQLVDFAAGIRAQNQVDNSFLYRFYPKQKQWDFGLSILKTIGYDFEAGQQDISTHPFTTSFGATDVRVTTRIDEHNFGSMTWSCIHEGGHGLYEQGFLMEEYGLPLGKAISLGIHESQSRLWENNVGRSLHYWKAHYAGLQDAFPGNLKSIDVNTFYKGINKISPSLIRTDSDEIHYHFHVLIRYEIEKALMEGTVEVDNLDQLWNEKYKTYLGIDVPDANHGILQDIHWAFGLIGYFPTYSLGSFYAAQFFNQAKKDIPNLLEKIERGKNQDLLKWLRDNIHVHGQYYTANELCEKITGETLNFQYFMDYVKEKYAGIYGE
ncbi:MAG: carboxypeptidase Taq, partial [Saprospiraceae bacterium]